MLYRIYLCTFLLLAAEVKGSDFLYAADLTWAEGINWLAGKATPVGSPAMPDTANTSTFSIHRASDYSYFGANFKFGADNPPPPELALAQPKTRAVFQRNEQNMAMVPVQGTYTDTPIRIEARAVVMDGFNGTATDWQVIDTAPAGGSFSATLPVSAGGWYSIKVRAFNGEAYGSTVSVDRIGIGEVFITAGQSNSANHGSPAMTPTYDTVSAWTGSSWRHAYDPQPIATGSGGSPWSRLGDILAEQFGCPIGFVSVGVGGTSVDQWVPGAAYYSRIQSAISAMGNNRFRAILWHQGESDSLASTSAATYASRLNSIIAQTRIDAGWDVPWGVALASYHPSSTTVQEAQVRAGQQQVIAGDPLVFQGADTDDFHLLGYLSDTVHFNNTGLYEHASGWKRAILKYFWSPQFKSNPIVKSDAVEGYDYSDTLSGEAKPMFGTTLTYSKVSGRRWLNVADDGTLSGVPSDHDTGANNFIIRATDDKGLWTDVILEITVHNTFTGELGLFDFAGLAASWLNSGCIDMPACGGADLTGDFAVLPDDLLIFADNWIAGSLPVAYLKFDETSGLVAHDSSLTGCNGVLKNFPADSSQWVAGQKNNALSFDGVNDYVQITGFKGVAGTSPRTCAAWIRPQNTGATGMITSWGRPDSGQKWYFRVNPTGELSVGVWGGYVAGTKKLADGQWYHVAAVLPGGVSPTVADIRLYVDGVQDSISGSSGLTQTINTSAAEDVFVGVSSNNGTLEAFFTGLIDDLRLYDHALTAAEINLLAK